MSCSSSCLFYWSWLLHRRSTWYWRRYVNHRFQVWHPYLVNPQQRLQWTLSSPSQASLWHLGYCRSDSTHRLLQTTGAGSSSYRPCLVARAPSGNSEPVASSHLPTSDCHHHPSAFSRFVLGWPFRYWERTNRCLSWHVHEPISFEMSRLRCSEKS